MVRLVSRLAVRLGCLLGLHQPRGHSLAGGGTIIFRCRVCGDRC